MISTAQTRWPKAGTKMLLEVTDAGLLYRLQGYGWDLLERMGMSYAKHHISKKKQASEKTDATVTGSDMTGWGWADVAVG